MKILGPIPALVVVRPLPKIRKPTPGWPAFDLPIAQFDVLHDCVRNHVALGVR